MTTHYTHRLGNQLSSDKLLFAVDDDQQRFATGQGIENKRLQSVYLCKHIYCTTLPL